MRMVDLCVTILVALIYSRMILQLFYGFIGLIFGILTLIVISNYIPLEQFDEIEFSRKRVHKTAFSKRKNWSCKLNQLKEDATIASDDQQIYPENFVINDTLNNLITLIIRDFVDLWYKRVSGDKLFQSSLFHELSYVTKQLKERLVEVDFSDLTIHTLIPLLNDHIEKIMVAHEVTRVSKIEGKILQKIKTTADDYVLASHYNRGKLHQGIKLRSDDPEKDLKKYLNRLASKMLPHLLEEEEVNSAPIRILVGEILSSFVLLPVCMMLSEPEFYNELLVSVLNRQMKDRIDVKRFRNVLRKHSTTFDTGRQINHPFLEIMPYHLSLSTSKAEFELLHNIVEKTNDRDTLLKFKYFMILQHEKILEPVKEASSDPKLQQKYIKRFDMLIGMINNKLSKIMQEQLPKVASEGNLSEFNQQITGLPTIQKEFEFHEILLSSTKLDFFKEFMKSRGDRYLILQFWVEANDLRNPLEYVNYSYDAPENIESQPVSNKIKPNEEDNAEDNYETNTLFFDKQLSQAEDIERIYNEYFSFSVMKIPPQIHLVVERFVKSEFADVLLYHRARKNIFKLQEFEYFRMMKSDFVAFKTSPMWTKMIIEEAVNRNKTTISKIEAISLHDFVSNDKLASLIESGSVDDENYGDPLEKYSEREGNGNYVDVNVSGKVSNKVIKAVEDALNEITTASAFKSQLDYVNNEKKNSRLVSDDVAKDLFGSDDRDNDLFGSNSLPPLNDTEDDLVPSIDDAASTASESTDQMESSDLQEVPDDLNLSEQIAKLNVEVERLEQQKSIINTLLQKAEIINNVPELKILKKSFISLEKELKLKVMQKEQYVVQEGKNSLYQKSAVDILNVISTKDKNGKSFTMYVIKVVKFTDSDLSRIAASWMVTRRYSQFYFLHNYLKKTYPEVSDIEFPKKRLVVKFMQNPLIEERQMKLRAYLQELIKNKNVCTDSVFRNFLSSEIFSASHSTNTSTIRPPKSDTSGTKLYNVVSTQALYPLLSLINQKGIIDYQLSGFEKNLFFSDTHEIGVDQEVKTKDISFFKPIGDLIVTIFHLNNSTSWLRGKALVLLFQQVFGSTVEKVVRSNIDGKLKQEETVSDLLTTLQDKLWPNGTFRERSKPRSSIDKERHKQQVRYLLHAFLRDTSAKIFGQTAAKEAAETIFLSFQNELLNRHLILSILDEIMLKIFPELTSTD